MNENIVADLERELSLGRTVVLHGPVGIGKSWALAELARRVRAAGLPLGLAPATRELGDVTRALAAAYPGIERGATSQRHLRARLRVAVEKRPGALLLDGLTAAGVALRAFLRDLRGTGLGVVVAVDVEGPRDHARMRGYRLSAHERAMPRAPRRALAAWLEGIPLTDRQRDHVLDIADGRPGWVVWMAERLRRPESWRPGGPAIALVHGDVAVEVARRYMIEPRPTPRNGRRSR